MNQNATRPIKKTLPSSAIEWTRWDSPNWNLRIGIVGPSHIEVQFNGAY